MRIVIYGKIDIKTFSIFLFKVLIYLIPSHDGKNDDANVSKNHLNTGMQKKRYNKAFKKVFFILY